MNMGCAAGSSIAQYQLTACDD